MLSDTLTDELERYRIGPRIKALRSKKKMGLVQLGAHTGLSSAMLSKIERGQLFPTLPTLLRIALVFGVDLDHFFSKEGSRMAVTRRGQRLRLPVPAAGGCLPICLKALTTRLLTDAWTHTSRSSRGLKSRQSRTSTEAPSSFMF